MSNRHISLLLTLLLGAQLAACGNAADNPSDTTTASQSVDSSSAVESGESSGVPAGTDLEGETISIWYTTKAASSAETFVDLNPELTGETLDDAIFNMNKAVEQKLNCTLEFFNSGVPTNETGDAAQKLVLAGDTTYDAFHLIQYNSAKLAAEGLYYNVKNAPYISLDKPWWNADYMNEMTVGNNAIYALVGDYCVDRTRTLNCVYYNKDMYADFYKDPEGLYTEVIDGKWTLDMYRKICSEVYSDLNNNGKIDLDDRLGSTTNTTNSIDSFFYAAGVRATQRDKDNIPSFCLNNERTVATVQKLYELVYETPGVFASTAEVESRQKFEAGGSMFLPGFFYTSEAMREMTSDFGIVPFPKLDEEQDDYVSDIHDIIRIMFLPAGCTKVDAVCAVLEEMSFIGYNEVLPSYYDVLMKNKYARDDISAQMLDIIRDNCRPDIAHIYGFSQMGYVGRRLIQSQSADFASYYTSIESAAKADLDDIIKAYTELT